MKKNVEDDSPEKKCFGTLIFDRYVTMTLFVLTVITCVRYFYMCKYALASCIFIFNSRTCSVSNKYLILKIFSIFFNRYVTDRSVTVFRLTMLYWYIS